MRAGPVAAALLVWGCVSACDTGSLTRTPVEPVPRCSDVERLALVAQSVPGAAYLPCLLAVPEGWETAGFQASRGTSSFALQPERGAEDRPVRVRLRRDCDLSGSSPEQPRAQGVRSAVRLRSVTPTYAGTRIDVFPGGCVETTFDLDRGPHVPLLEDLDTAVGLVRRRELDVALREELGVELDP